MLTPGVLLLSSTKAATTLPPPTTSPSTFVVLWGLRPCPLHQSQTAGKLIERVFNDAELHHAVGIDLHCIPPTQQNLVVLRLQCLLLLRFLLEDPQGGTWPENAVDLLPASAQQPCSHRQHFLIEHHTGAREQRQLQVRDSIAIGLHP